MSNETFRPTGNTYMVSCSTSTAGAATQIAGNPALRIVNSSTVDAFLAFGSSSVQISQPSTATPSAAVPVMQRTERIFTVGPSTAASYGWLNACTSAGTAILYVTAGTGRT